MKRTVPISLACTFAFLLALPAIAAASTPNPNSAVVKTRIFNDCPFSTVSVTNSYPALISIEDAGLACSGFANMHNWTFSTDGLDGAAFDNNADFRVACDFMLSGTGNGEGGLRISPWWSKDVDGLFNVRSTDGEIACFGGRLPFYNFTATYGLHYVKGTTIHLEMTYKPNGLGASSPATVEYALDYNGTHYSSGALNFDQANPAEDPPHGLWGMLNDGRVGGHIKGFMDPGNFNSGVKATFTNISLVICPIEPNPNSATLNLRVFNDCPFTTLDTVNNYPSEVSFNDQGLACSGFANLHTWSFADGQTSTVFNNNSDFSFSADLKLTGASGGFGEAGLRISPWYSHDVDGRFNIRTPDGEIACFGGRLPFFSFTNAFGLHYADGQTIRLGVTYHPNGLSSTSPGTIEYTVCYQGQNYTSGALNFDQANPSEDPPHGVWGILNDARAGGYEQPRMDPGNFNAGLKASFTNIQFDSGVHVDLDIWPKVLLLKSYGKWLFGVIRPPATYAASDIDVGSIRLNGMLAPDPHSFEFDWFGGPLLIVKFDRKAAVSVVGPHGLFTVTGAIAGNCFAGSDHVKILKIHRPAANSQAAVGSVVPIEWSTPEGMNVQSVVIYSSLDDGETWDEIASGLPNTEHYDWLVPNTLSTQARIAVGLVDGDGDGLGVSDPFTIATPLAVGNQPLVFALRGAVPNPGVRRLSVDFTLPQSGTATLAAYDIAGRQVAFREVGSLGAGRHSVAFDQLPAGVYMLKLSQGSKSLTTRAAVVQ